MQSFKNIYLHFLSISLFVLLKDIRGHEVPGHKHYFLQNGRFLENKHFLKHHFTRFSQTFLHLTILDIFWHNIPDISRNKSSNAKFT